MSTCETMKVLGPKGVAFLKDRGLDPEVAGKYGLYTGRALAEGKVVPDRDGDVIVFPYFERGTVVAEKYRTRAKRFWQRRNGRRTFWNSDVLDDPAALPGCGGLLVLAGEGILAELVLELLDAAGREPCFPGEQAVVLSQPPRREHPAIVIRSPWVDPTDLIAREHVPGLRVLCALAIGTGRVSEGIEVHRDHEVAVVGLAGQDVAGDIALV
jgi:hypothetical protein